MNRDALRVHWQPWTPSWPTGLRFLVSGGRLSEPQLEAAADLVTRRHATEMRGVQAEQWIFTPQGWSGVLVGTTDFDLACRWLKKFVTELPEGCEILGAPKSRAWAIRDRSLMPTWITRLSTIDLSQVDGDARQSQWSVPSTASHRALRDVVAWCESADGSTRLIRDTKWIVELAGQPSEKALDAAARWDPHLRFESRTPKTKGARFVQLAPQGVLAAQTVEPGAEPLTAWESLKVLMWPSNTDYAYLTLTEAGRPRDHRVRFAHVGEPDLRARRDLLSSFVPDVHGVQMLTSGHLSRAHDLSGWDVVDLGHDRFLVSARDLTPWLTGPSSLDYTSPPVLDLAVLAQARKDFGGMILTPEAVATHPRH